MCFGSGNKEDPEAKKSKEIEKQLREDQKRLAKEVKLLLLGNAYHLYRGRMEALTRNQVRENRENRQSSNRCD